MKKQLTILLCGLSVTMSAAGAILTPAEALSRLDTPGMHKALGRSVDSHKLVYTATTQNGEPAVYVFGNSPGKGYMLLSADDKAAPVLGYADSGSFDPNNMPEQLKWWIGEYGRQIAYARALNAPAYVAEKREERKEVAPMIKSRWNQTSPYNDLVPQINGVHCPTGCVATAVAQVMNYWQYPERATGTGIIENPTTGGKESMALDEEPFAWNDMLDVYTDAATDAQKHAVAYLMKAVGYASEMRYGQYSSGAFSYIAGLALINNFGYNSDLQYCTRSYYDPQAWEELIYNEVASGRPVIYGGQSTSVGHEFVCDGYNGDGYFHFNWGWSGMSDGYFLLDSLNPNALGTGGGEGGGYNYAQDALVGVQPTKEQIFMPNLVQFGALRATASGLNLDFELKGSSSNWFNVGLSDVTLSLGVEFKAMDSDAAPEYVNIVTGKVAKPEHSNASNGSLSLSYHGITGNVSTKMPFYLADGKYKVTIVTQPSGSSVWIPVQTLPKYYNYVYVTKEGSKLTVENMADATITLESAEPLSVLYYGCVARMKVVATNNSEKELTQGFYPELFFDGVEHMLGDGVVLTIPPQTTVTKEFITTFRLLSGGSAPTSRRQYQLGWYDPVNGQMYDIVQDVIMNVVTNTPNLTVNSFEIPGVTPEATNISGVGGVSLYTVAGTDEVDFKLSLTNNRGFFGYPLSVVIFEASGSSYDLATSLFDPLVILEARESAETEAKVNLSMLQKDHPYVALVYYQSAKEMEYLDACPPLYFQLTEAAGVEEIGVGNDAPVKYYNMQGVEVSNPAKGMLLIKKQGTKTSKVIF